MEALEFRRWRPMVAAPCKLWRGSSGSSVEQRNTKQQYIYLVHASRQFDPDANVIRRITSVRRQPMGGVSLSLKLFFVSSTEA